jgi:putative addiction module component (TIGR02574 family)
MSASIERIEREALELPLEERVRLVDKLWESLGNTTVPVLSEEWQTEIERRRREILEGKVKPVPGEEVSRRAWERVNSKKA